MQAKTSSRYLKVPMANVIALLRNHCLVFLVTFHFPYFYLNCIFITVDN